MPGKSAGGRRRILVIDDEPDIAGLLKLFLAGLHYEVDTFLSPRAGLDALKENGYWAVFCDYMMPHLTGDRVYRAIKELDSALLERFVLVTGAVLDERLERFVESEGARVLNKPFRLDEIKAVLKEFETS
ncbi:MAG: response regulator [Nitrospirota bacterium]